MHKEIARNALAVFLEAAPARPTHRIKSAFRGGTEPRLPIDGLWGKIRRNGVDPRPAGIIPPQRCLHQSHLADSSLLHQFAGLGKSNGTAALAADLHNPLVPFLCLHHFETLSHRMAHGLLAVDVLSSARGFHHKPHMPMVGNGSDDGIDLLVVEKVLITRSDRDGGILKDFLCQFATAAVKVAGSG